MRYKIGAMKKNNVKKSILLLAVVLGFTGCYKDVVKPTEPYNNNNNTPPQNVSFSGQLIPFFAANCAASGCHGGAHDPNLTAAQAYTSLMSGGYVNTGNPAASTLYTEVQSGNMPVGGTTTSAQKQMILDWIRNGAPNN